MSGVVLNTSPPAAYFCTRLCQTSDLSLWLLGTPPPAMAHSLSDCFLGTDSLPISFSFGSSIVLIFFSADLAALTVLYPPGINPAAAPTVLAIASIGSPRLAASYASPKPCTPSSTAMVVPRNGTKSAAPIPKGSWLLSPPMNVCACWRAV